MVQVVRPACPRRSRVLGVLRRLLGLDLRPWRPRCRPPWPRWRRSCHRDRPRSAASRFGELPSELWMSASVRAQTSAATTRACDLAYIGSLLMAFSSPAASSGHGADGLQPVGVRAGGGRRQDAVDLLGGGVLGGVRATDDDGHRRGVVDGPGHLGVGHGAEGPAARHDGQGAPNSAQIDAVSRGGGAAARPQASVVISILPKPTKEGPACERLRCRRTFPPAPRVNISGGVSCCHPEAEGRGTPPAPQTTSSWMKVPPPVLEPRDDSKRRALLHAIPTTAPTPSPAARRRTRAAWSSGTSPSTSAGSARGTRRRPAARTSRTSPPGGPAGPPRSPASPS